MHSSLGNKSETPFQKKKIKTSDLKEIESRRIVTRGWDGWSDERGKEGMVNGHTNIVQMHESNLVFESTIG